MQQRSPAPDDYAETHDSDGYEIGGYDAPDAPPRLTPDEVAEQSALEVFPGAEKALESDQWWLQNADDPTPDGSTPEPIDLQQHQQDPLEHSEPPVPSEGHDPSEASDQTDEPVNSGTPGSEIAASDVARPGTTEVAEHGSPLMWAPETAEVGAEVPVTPAATARLTDHLPTSQPPAATAGDIPESALTLPLLSGRAQRESAGASQRAAIMAAAGAPIDLEGEAELPATGQSYPRTNRQPPIAAQGRAAPPAASLVKPRRSFTRKLSLVLIVGALAVLLLSGGAFASGQGAEVEHIAASIAPDVLERWISDRVSSFGGASTAPLDSGSTAAPTTPDDQSLSGQIAHTGGVGVPIRSTCIPEARTPRTIPEGSSITVIARGVGDCSGWSVVRAGATVSWVESAFLEPTP